LLLEGYLEKFTVENAYTVTVYVKPALKRHLEEGTKLVVQLRTAQSDQLPGKKRGSDKKRKVPQSPHAKEGRADDNDNDNSDFEAGAGEEDFGDCSGEDGEGDDAAAGASPTKRRRSNNGPSSCVSASPRNAGVGRSAGITAISIPDLEDSEWTGNVPGASAVARGPLRRSGRRRASGRAPPGTMASPYLDQEVIEISSD